MCGKRVERGIERERGYTVCGASVAAFVWFATVAPFRAMCTCVRVQVGVRSKWAGAIVSEETCFCARALCVCAHARSMWVRTRVPRQWSPQTARAQRRRGRDACARRGCLCAQAQTKRPRVLSPGLYCAGAWSSGCAHSGGDAGDAREGRLPSACGDMT